MFGSRSLSCGVPGLPSVATVLECDSLDGPAMGPCTAIILDIAELWAQGAKSRQGRRFQRAFAAPFLKDETLKLVLLQQNTQLGKEVKSGASGPGLWCLPGSTASTQVGEGVFWVASSVDCAFGFLHLPPKPQSHIYFWDIC